MADAIEAAAEAIAAQAFQDMGLPTVQWQTVAETVKVQYRVYAKAALAAADAARLKGAPEIAKRLRDAASGIRDAHAATATMLPQEYFANLNDQAAALITAQAARIEAQAKVIEKARIYAQARQAFPGERFEDVLENTGWDLAETYREFERSEFHARAALTRAQKESQ